MMLWFAGCVSRPLPPRTTVDQLIEASLMTSSAPRGGDENFIGGSTSTPMIHDGPPIQILSGPANLEMDSVDRSASTDQIKPIHLYHPTDVIESVSFDDELKINEEFIETDVREALTTMALETDMDLIMDDAVTGIINTRIDDLTIDQAVEKVLMPLGYCSVRRGRQIIVSSTDPESPLFSYVAVNRSYQPLHQDLKTLVETVPKKSLRFVREIAKTKTLVVEAPPRIADDLMRRFAEMDQPIPQVVLEAIICVVSPDTGFQFGLDWQHAVELDDATALAAGASGLALNGTISKSGL
ncbi:MAG: protein transporter, partial [Planctomycetota bacterium]